MIGPEGIPAERGNLFSVEDRPHGGALAKGDVGVPIAPKVEAALIRLLDQLEHLGVIRHAEDELVALQVAEPPPEGHQLHRCQVLVGKKDDQVVQEGSSDIGHALVAQRLRQIHLGDLGAEGAGDPVHLEPGCSGFHATPPVPRSRRDRSPI